LWEPSTAGPATAAGPHAQGNGGDNGLRRAGHISGGGGGVAWGVAEPATPHTVSKPATDGCQPERAGEGARRAVAGVGAS